MYDTKCSCQRLVEGELFLEQAYFIGSIIDLILKYFAMLSLSKEGPRILLIILDVIPQLLRLRNPTIDV